jgi:hypothetical protein
MPVNKVNGEIIETPFSDRRDFEETGVVRDDSFAISDDLDRTKQIKFEASPLSADSSVTLRAGASSGAVTITLPSSSGTLATTAGASNVFSTIQVPSGTSPTADSATDTLTLAAGSGISITGDSTTDTITIASTATPVTAVTATAPMVSSGGTTPDLSLDRINLFSISTMVGPYVDDFIHGNATSVLDWVSNNGGSGASISTYTGAFFAGHPGVIQLSCGTATNGWVALYGNTTSAHLLVGGGIIKFEAIVRVPVASDGTNTFSPYVGLINAPSSEPSNGIYFRITNGNWEGCTALFPGRSVTASSVAATTGAFQRLTFVTNAAGTSVEFFVGGVSIGTLSTNTPDSTALLHYGLTVVKSAGTTARTMLVDAVGIAQSLTTPR